MVSTQLLHAKPQRALRRLVFTAAVACSAGATLAADPYAANNGFYPDPASKTWPGPYRNPNYRYPAQAPGQNVTQRLPRQPISVQTAPAYLATLKTYVEPTLRKMIEEPSRWDPAASGWYDMVWQASGSNASGGRESILGAFSGQVILKDTLARSGLTVDMQNHTVIYYDATAATTLARLWANPMNPNRSVVSFPEGAVIVKAAAVSPTEKQWPVVEGSAVWNVYRPPVAEVIAYNKNPQAPLNPVVTPLRVLQFDIIVKDSVASPQTGWVFSTFVYDRSAKGPGTWERLVPLGAQWGNDPQWANRPSGRGPNNEPLRETWINPGAPAYALETLGWGGRLSGPIDVARRHNVLLSDGTVLKEKATSSCMSCHGTAQFPWVTNLYPSPNKSFPPEGTLFPMFVPGSEPWSRWFQNRSGSVPQNANAGAVALDYDMLIMIALATFDATAGSDRFVQKLPPRAH